MKMLPQGLVRASVRLLKGESEHVAPVLARVGARTTVVQPGGYRLAPDDHDRRARIAAQRRSVVAERPIARAFGQAIRRRRDQTRRQALVAEGRLEQLLKQRGRPAGRARIARVSDDEYSGVALPPVGREIDTEQAIRRLAGVKLQ